jgi:hypothetical protein
LRQRTAAASSLVSASRPASSGWSAASTAPAGPPSRRRGPSPLQPQLQVRRSIPPRARARRLPGSVAGPRQLGFWTSGAARRFTALALILRLAPTWLNLSQHVAFFALLGLAEMFCLPTRCDALMGIQDRGPWPL